ncbi:MAG: hypothetical protein IPO92_05660 [Saprospiraceae bacterium]|nr:hypothetical protein [Saprospiraceae bacterium]
MKIIHLFSLVIILGFLSACSDRLEITDSYYKPDELEIIKRYLNLPSKPFDYNIRYPGYINTFVNTTIGVQ